MLAVVSDDARSQADDCASFHGVGYRMFGADSQVSYDQNMEC
ncbi:uncharacterized protein METZ01_LOCUS37586 [marine metagenome]|uniref:Uncharacterized protein n=1 Tax=marine metagenome TaxID=408172 RepID=A0A381QZ66_9ZZZZ